MQPIRIQKMRLGQLSRKVNIKPSEIQAYLKNEFDVELGSHLNTKVDDELTEKVIKKFAVKVTKKPVPMPPKVEKTPEEVIENNSTSADEEPVLVIEEKTETVEETLSVAVKEFEVNEEVDVDIIKNATLIKAPKVELAGPTVVGKIELPPSLEEQMVEVDGVMMSKAVLAERKREERKERREKRELSKGSGKRSTRNVRESRKKSEAQLEQIKHDKESEQMANRLAHREKRITEKKKKIAKVKPKYEAKKTKKKPVEKPVSAVKESIQKPKPTTWHGKLWLWFNT